MANSCSRNGLSARQLRGARMEADPLEQRTLAQIAKAIGVSERTFHRWRELPEYVAERERVIDLTVSAITPPALKRLQRIIRNGSDKNANTAIRTALMVGGRIQNGTRVITTHVHQHEVDEARLPDRIAEVRAKHSGNGAGNGRGAFSADRLR